jgi:cellulose synthase (UDP-forming)
VTAKGGDRARGFVEWGLMRPFAILIAASILAIVYAFYVNGQADTIRYSAPALAWCWYNLIVLIVLCFVCVEQPRLRGAVRVARDCESQIAGRGRDRAARRPFDLRRPHPWASAPLARRKP